MLVVSVVMSAMMMMMMKLMVVMKGSKLETEQGHGVVEAGYNNDNTGDVDDGGDK